MNPVISKQRTLKHIQIQDFHFNAKYRIFHSTIKITVDTKLRRIILKKVHFEKTPFDDGHFSNEDKKHEDQIPLLFSQGAC